MKNKETKVGERKQQLERYGKMDGEQLLEEFGGNSPEFYGTIKSYHKLQVCSFM